MGRGPASIRGRIRLAHAIVPMVLRKRAFAMPKKVTPIAASARNCGQTISNALLANVAVSFQRLMNRIEQVLIAKRLG
jgi:hypothetical protein